MEKGRPGGWVPEDSSGIGPPTPLRFGRRHRSRGGTCLRSQSQQSPSWATQGDQACVQVAPNIYSLVTGSPSEVRQLRASAFPLRPSLPTPRPPLSVIFENSSTADWTQALPEPTLTYFPETEHSSGQQQTQHSKRPPPGGTQGSSRGPLRLRELVHRTGRASSWPATKKRPEPRFPGPVG